jgi:photosystem II stability/assembly factor-like uncharacterized protein
MELLLATQAGFAAAAPIANTWQVVRKGLDGRHVTSIIAREGVILVGTTDGIFVSDDGGASWQEASDGLTHRHVRWLAFHPDISDREFAGTEPAAVFTSPDGGASWQECPEVGALRDRFGWWLPYSPAAGCVRGFTFHGQRAYAAVEVGGALRSDDFGASWRLADGSDGRAQFGRPSPAHIHPDVHDIAVHPASPDLVFAPTGGGLFRSEDGGETWTHLDDGYVRAVWLDPKDANHLLIGPADGPSGRNGRILQSFDGGQSWSEPLATWKQNMPERLAAAGGSLFAVMAGGQLLAASPDHRQWQPILATIPGINAFTTMK